MFLSKKTLDNAVSYLINDIRSVVNGCVLDDSRLYESTIVRVDASVFKENVSIIWLLINDIMGLSLSKKCLRDEVQSLEHENSRLFQQKQELFKENSELKVTISQMEQELAKIHQSPHIDKAVYATLTTKGAISTDHTISINFDNPVSFIEDNGKFHIFNKKTESVLYVGNSADFISLTIHENPNGKKEIRD